METQIQRNNSSSGQEVHVCRKCGWPFPKPHPSARHRRAHKRVCGTIEGYKVQLDAYDDEHLSDDDDGKTLTDGSKSVEKSTRRAGSEEELFADAVTEFAEVRESANVAIADAGNLYPPSSANGAQAHTAECLAPENERARIDTPPQQNLPSSSVDSIPSPGPGAKDGESSAGESTLQRSGTANEATLDNKPEEVANEEHFGSDGKTDSSEKSFQATEEAGRPLETFTSCNDSFHNLVETDYLLLRKHTEAILEDRKDQRTDIGETVDSSEALPQAADELSVEKKVEKAQQNLILTDASARNFLNDIDSLTCSVKDARICDARGPEVDATNVAKEELTVASVNFSAADNGVRSGEVEKLSDERAVDQAEAEGKLEHELLVVSLELKDAIPVGNNVRKSLQESEAANNAISGTADNVDIKQEGTAAALGIQFDSDTDTAKRADVESNGETRLIEEKEGLNFGFVDGDVNLMKKKPSESALIGQVEAERKLEHELAVASLESKDAILVENKARKSLQELEAANKAISGTGVNVDSMQSIAMTKEGDSDPRKQEETGAALGIQVDSDTAKRDDVESNGETRLIEEKGLNFGFVDGDMNLVKEKLPESALIGQVEAERRVEHELPVASLASKDTIPAENDVRKILQESEAANNATSGTGGNVDSTLSLAINKERDLDQGKQEETVAALGIQADSDTVQRADVGLKGKTRLIEENEGVSSGLTDGDVILMREEQTVSTFDSVKGESNRDGTDSGSAGGDRNPVKREEAATVSALDVQADSSSQTDSLEGNQGSVVSAATETGSQPSQTPAKVQTDLPPGSNDEESEISKPSLVEQKEAQIPQIPHQPADETPGRKKNGEIGTEKQHMPLKSFLGESSPPKNTPVKEAGQEWNSPARYPTNIKREKSKARSRAWAPFICCTSAQAS